jgi:hypothetical protein
MGGQPSYAGPAPRSFARPTPLPPQRWATQPGLGTPPAGGVGEVAKMIAVQRAHSATWPGASGFTFVQLVTSGPPGLPVGAASSSTTATASRAAAGAGAGAPAGQAQTGKGKRKGGGEEAPAPAKAKAKAKPTSKGAADTSEAAGGAGAGGPAEAAGGSKQGAGAAAKGAPAAKRGAAKKGPAPASAAGPGRVDSHAPGMHRSAHTDAYDECSICEVRCQPGCRPCRPVGAGTWVWWGMTGHQALLCGRGPLGRRRPRSPA